MPPELPPVRLTAIHEEFERTMYQLVFWVHRPAKPIEVAEALEKAAERIRKGT